MIDKKRLRLSPVDLAGLGACLALTMVFVFGVFSPLWVHHIETDAQSDELNVQKNKAHQLAMDVQSLNSQLAAARLTIAKNPLRLESEDHLNDRLAGITVFSKTCGLEIQDIVPGPWTAGARYNTVSIHMVGHGSYRSYVTFLHQLHVRYLDTSVRGFRLTGDPKDSVAPLSVAFDLVWFARPASVAQTE